MEKRKYLFLIGVIVFIVAISGCTSSNTTSTSGNQTSTESQSNVFENKFISFDKPDNLRIVDESNDTYLKVRFYNGDEMVGDIQGYGTSKTKADVDNIVSLSKGELTVAGYRASTDGDSSGSQTIIFIPDDNQGAKAMIQIYFDSEFVTKYQEIRDSLVIKQIPN